MIWFKHSITFMTTKHLVTLDTWYNAQFTLGAGTIQSLNGHCPAYEFYQSVGKHQARLYATILQVNLTEQEYLHLQTILNLV